MFPSHIKKTLKQKQNKKKSQQKQNTDQLCLLRFIQS